MGKQPKMQSFFKRKREEEVVEHTSAPDALALVVFVNQRQGEDGHGNQMQDEEEQENPISQDEQEEEQQASEPVIFRGMELLERDPALRPQVWQYPANQRDDVRRAYLRLGPMQPKLNRYEAQVDEIARLLSIDQIETGKGANQICSLKRPGETRWGSHLGSVASLMHLFNLVRLVLEKLGGDSSAGANRADGDTAFTYLISFEFVFILCMMRDILETSEDLGKALQKKTQDIVNAVRLVHSTKVLLEDMRSDEGWDKFILTVIEFCVEHGVDIPDMEATYILRGGRARRQPDHFTTERYLRVEIYRATIDSQLTELNFRFNEKVMDLLSISVTLIPRNRFRSFSAKEVCSMVEKYYPADFTQQERYGLELQLNRFVVDAKNSKELRKPATITTLCRCLVETGRDRIYNWLDRLLRLLVTLPISTASAERAFSSLKIIKSRLRNRMEDDLLANSMLLQIEREIALKIGYEDVIADFKATKNRRAFL